MSWLAEKDVARPQPRKGEEITLFPITRDYRLAGPWAVGPLRDAVTHKKWELEEAAQAAWQGATIIIRPPTPEELHWAEEELKRIIKEVHG